ncbi:hypothetical protein D3C73_1650560 [compost metagenome]
MQRPLKLRLLTLVLGHHNAENHENRNSSRINQNLNESDELRIQQHIQSRQA